MFDRYSAGAKSQPRDKKLTSRLACPGPALVIAVTQCSRVDLFVAFRIDDGN